MTRVWHDSALPSRVSEIVRGPASLRQDIADEIADHLACHTEESAQSDPVAARQEAVAAFGDVETIGRELRTVHWGDWIMFQKVMVAALVLIVAGMATSTYFSYSATRTMSQQMADVTRETSRQFAEVSKHLATLSDHQLAGRPPRVKVFCYTVAPQTPVADYELTIDSLDYVGNREVDTGKTFSNTYRSDAGGWLDSGPLPLGIYQLRGRVTAPGDGPNTIQGSWTEVVRLQQNGVTWEVRRCVGSNTSYDIRIDPATLPTWDLEKMKTVEVSFSQNLPPRIHQIMTRTWSSARFAIDLRQGAKVVGLLPGEANALVGYGGVGRNYISCVSRPAETCHISEVGGALVLSMGTSRSDSNTLVGRVYQGSKDRPVVGARLELLHGYSTSDGRSMAGSVLRCDPESLVREFLRTDASGQFRTAAWGHEDILLHWKTPDGTPAVLRLPVHVGKSGQNYEMDFDVTKLCTVRLVCTGIDKALDAFGASTRVSRQPGVDWHEGRPGRGSSSPRGYLSVERSSGTVVRTVLMIPGYYEFVPVLLDPGSVRNSPTTLMNRVSRELDPGESCEIVMDFESCARPRSSAPARPSLSRPVTTSGGTSRPNQ